MSNNLEFFRDKQPAAVYKHGIISRYPGIFFSKTGSVSQGGRGVYFDAFAGPGEYRNGETGSPVIAADMAEAVAKFGRSVTCVFSEKNHEYASNLETVMQNREGLPTIEVHNTAALDQVDHVLDAATNLPLLSFLDPYGTALPFDVVVGKLLRQGTLPTELILNFNVEMFSRAGGIAAKTMRTSAEEASLRRFDQFAGGTWWHQHFADYRSGELPTAMQRAKLVAQEYAKRVRERAKYGSVITPVYRKENAAPIFYLMLFFRHPDAAGAFAEAASMAYEEWRTACYVAQRVNEPEALPLFEDLKEEELRRQTAILDARWSAEISSGLRLLAETRGPCRIKVGEHLDDIYGETLGYAREKHLRKAWKELATEGLLGPCPTGKLYQSVLTVHPR